jgi:uncharacterized membrane protein
LTLLILAALLWLGIHIGVAGTGLRDTVAARLGDKGFRGAFALASVVSLVLLALAYNGAVSTFLWEAPDWLRYLLALLMLGASILLVGAFATRNPTAPGGEAVRGDAVRGAIRITRHPALWAFAIWGFVHILGNGDTASVVFFGTFLITALAGMPSLDGKLARRDPAWWATIAAATSIVPFVAIREGRNRLLLPELTIPIAGGAVLWILLLFAHRHVIGVSPLPITLP